MTSCSVAGPNPDEPRRAAERTQLELLEGAAVADPLQAALATLGATLNSWSLLQVHHRPGAGATGIYEVQVSTTGGDPSTEFLCVSTADLPSDLPATVRLTGADHPALTVWLHPHDPLLPGLPWACDVASVSRALFGEPSLREGIAIPARSAASLATVSYRPLRRAVLSVDLAGERRYLKVLRQGQGARLAERHRLLRQAGIPAPQLIEVQAPDVLAMHRAEGTPLAELLLHDGAESLHPQALLDLLYRLPVAALELPQRPAWAERVSDYAQGAIAALPEEAARITRVADQVRELVAAVDAGPRVPSHGDFYEGNLLVKDGVISGVLDVDALGPGHLVDDLACFIGHLAVLPALDRRYHHVPRALERFLTAFDRVVDPAGLRGRAAGVALTLVAGAKHRSTAADSVSWRGDALQRLAIAEELISQAASLTARES